MIIPLVNTKSCFFFLGNIWWFFFRTSMLIALGDLIPASPETITSDSAAQLTGGDPWIDGLEGFFVLKSLWIQETPWILVFKILNFVWGFVCSSSVQVLYIYICHFSHFWIRNGPIHGQKKLFLSPTTEVVLLCHWIITSNTVLFIQ